MHIGSHVSIRGGYKEAAVRALALGGTAYQFFPKNPRSLGVKPFDRNDAARCAAYCRERGLVSIAHAPYPVNLAADDATQRMRTVESLRNDLEIAEACGAAGVVVHFGIYKGPAILEGYRLIIGMLNEVLEGWGGAAKLLLENQAGDHAPMGTTFEELVQIRRLCAYPDKIGYCLDTCHLFASGVWDGGNEAVWADHARSLGYLDELVAVHANDSRYPSGDRKDRHAIIGEGCIGKDAFRRLLAVPEIRRAALVLETPEAAGRTHRDQITLLRAWAREDSEI